MGFDVLIMIFWTLIVLSVLVFFHELGHFLAAKISGIRVETFSIGFPPRAFGKKIGDTDYCISYTPLGGYCKMAGMVDESLDTKNIKGEPWEFMSKPIPVRMFALLAGPMMNFFLAFILFAGLVYAIGIPTRDDSSRIGNITPDTAAEAAGLQPLDRIIQIDDSPVRTWMDLTNIIRVRPLETVIITIDRGGEILTKEVTIEKRDNPLDDLDEEIGMLGIEQGLLLDEKGDVINTPISLFTSLKYGYSQTINITVMIAQLFKSIFFGEESVKNLGGPLVIAKFIDESRKRGFGNLIAFMAFLSLNLGFMNLLPIPVLDGGHLLILSVEGIVRRQLPIKAKLMIQQFGMVFLFGLMVVIFYNDIMRYVTS